MECSRKGMLAIAGWRAGTFFTDTRLVNLGKGGRVGLLNERRKLVQRLLPAVLAVPRAERQPKLYGRVVWRNA